MGRDWQPDQVAAAPALWLGAAGDAQASAGLLRLGLPTRVRPATTRALSIGQRENEGMPLGELPGLLPPHIAHEAVRLIYEVVGKLHAVTANGSGVLFALAASPQLADRLAAFGASIEDDEDDASAEGGEGLAAREFDALFASVPLQGHAVTPWVPPDRSLASEPDLSRHWPDLVRPPADAS